MAIVDEIHDILGKASLEIAWAKAKAENREPTTEEINETFKLFFGKPANYKKVRKPDYKSNISFQLNDE